jgi:hypothetical protein
VDVRVIDQPNPNISAIGITGEKVQVQKADGDGVSGWKVWATRLLVEANRTDQSSLLSLK